MLEPQSRSFTRHYVLADEFEPGPSKACFVNQIGFSTRPTSGIDTELIFCIFASNRVLLASIFNHSCDNMTLPLLGCDMHFSVGRPLRKCALAIKLYPSCKIPSHDCCLDTSMVENALGSTHTQMNVIPHATLECHQPL